MPVRHAHRKTFMMLAKNPVHGLKQIRTHGSWYDYEDRSGAPVGLRTANVAAYRNGHEAT